MSELPAIHILSAARLLFHPGDVVEVRVPKAGRQRTISGYFDDMEKLAESVGQLERSRPAFPGIYWTLNPVGRDLLSLAENKVKSFADITSKDADVLTRRLLPLDFDPIRHTGISSTDEEHAAALNLAETVRAELSAAGWPEPISADSGNGAHLLYLIDLPNDQLSGELLKRILYALAARFDTAAVTVDKTTHNASRIFKAYGTTARKGDNTAERPHRLSHILQVPALLTPVSPELLHKLAADAPSEARSQPAPSRSSSYSSGASSFSLDQFLSRFGIRHRPPVPHEGGRKFVLEYCPFDSSHKAPDSAVFERPDGYGFKCFHNSCSGKDWKDFRELFEPRRTTHMGSRPEAPPSETMPPAEDPAEPDLTSEDVQAAVDEAIAADDLIACLRMVPNIAKLSLLDRSIIKAKLKKAFQEDFSGREFDKVLLESTKEAKGGDGQGKNPPAGPPGEMSVEGSPPADVPDLRFYPLTDGGNGERIVALFGKDIRYCVEMRKWLVWDGKRWAIDEFNVMRQKGKQMARLLYSQSAKEDTPTQLKAALDKHARLSEMYSGISSALGQAATEPGIPISALDLDIQIMLLNCPNGVVDLTTGKLLPHKREFLMTKLCPVEYLPNAKCPQFLEFLRWAMGAVEDRELSEHTKALVAFLARAFGYALTGDVSTRVVFVFYGEGKNGKSTLLNLFRDVLGSDYSSQLLIDTVMSMKKQDATARADLADLRGARFVVTTEVEEEHKLNLGTIKSITAGKGSMVKSCRKYENPIEFPAQHHMFMDCNHRPRVSTPDKATWDRMRLVPFLIRISEEEEDAELPTRLRTELPGVLAWAVRGCLAMFKEGLGNPPEIASAAQDWRDHDDPLKDFLEDSCNVEEGLFVSVSDLMAGYVWWCKENSERWPLGRQKFNEHLALKGFKQDRKTMDALGTGKKKTTRIWSGIELKTEVTSAIRQSKPGAWLDKED